jgi:hypothetical protein
MPSTHTGTQLSRDRHYRHILQTDITDRRILKTDITDIQTYRHTSPERDKEDTNIHTHRRTSTYSRHHVYFCHRIDMTRILMLHLMNPTARVQAKSSLARITTHLSQNTTSSDLIKVSYCTVILYTHTHTHTHSYTGFVLNHHIHQEIHTHIHHQSTCTSFSFNATLAIDDK